MEVCMIGDAYSLHRFPYIFDSSFMRKFRKQVTGKAANAERIHSYYKLISSSSHSFSMAKERKKSLIHQ